MSKQSFLHPPPSSAPSDFIILHTIDLFMSYYIITKSLTPSSLMNAVDYIKARWDDNKLDPTNGKN